MKLRINNKEFEFFNDFTLTLNYNNVASTFSFRAFFDPLNTDHRGLFKPFTYPRIQVRSDEGELLLTGFVVNNTFTDSSKDELVTLSGYSLPGVLEDCEIPIELYPLQSDGKTLKEITEAIIRPFGLNLVISSDVSDRANQVYEKNVADEGQSIKSYLSELAAQKNIVLSHTAAGSLLFTQARVKSKAVAHLGESLSSTKLALSTTGQPMHSTITVQKQVDLENDNAGEETIVNPFVTTTFRPKTKSQNSGDDIDTVQALRNSLSSEISNIKLKIDTDRWEWIKNGVTEIMKPNNIITVHNHNIYIYRITKFFVESIVFTGNKNAETAALNCVIPEVYNSQTPSNIFDLPNPHD